MQKFTQVVCSDNYTEAATISGVPSSNGGYFIIQNADVFIELEYGGLGQFQFIQNESFSQPNNGVLDPGTSGIRFRNATAGQNATVTAAIYEEAEPRLVLTGGGQASVTTNILTGIVTSAGAITAGTGFSVVHAATGTYDVTFTVPFASQAVVSVTVIANGAGPYIIDLASPASSGFRALIRTPGGVMTDVAWNFTAEAVA